MEMQRIRELALSRENTQFYIADRLGVPLVTRHSTDGAEQLVIPCTHGLSQLIMLELHVTPIAGHMGTRKMV